MFGALGLDGEEGGVGRNDGMGDWGLSEGVVLRDIEVWPLAFGGRARCY